jgi:hypothetical protein
MTRKSNTVSFPTGFFVVQSCDENEANIGIFLDGAQGALYRHVEVPTLFRNHFERDYPGQMTGVEFDGIVSANRAKLLALIDDLNSDEAQGSINTARAL